MEERTAMLPLLLAALLSTTPAAQAQSPPSPAASDVRSAVIAADDARLASPAHRKVVEDTLKNGPTDAQVLAVRALGRTRRAEWLPAATAALDHASIDVRREAAFSVAQIGNGDPGQLEPARAALVRRLAVEQDLLVLASLAESLGRLRYAGAPGVAAAARDLATAYARVPAGPGRTMCAVGVARGAEALARRTRTLKADGAATAPLADLLGTLLDDAAPEAGATRPDILRRRTRRLATMGLSALGPLPAARLAAAQVDEDDQVRRLAVLALAARGDAAASEAGWAFADRSVLVRHAAQARLGARHVALAEKGAADPHVHVRLAALDALGEARACGAVCDARLAAGPQPDAWHEYAHAVVARARTEAAAARPVVATAAASPIWQVRMYAARAAGETTQADVLARLAGDANPNVQHAALVAWRSARLPGLVPAASAALASNDGQLVLEAATALKGAAPDEALVATLRGALARITAQQRETSRDPRMALVERIDELDAQRETTLRPYLSDFDNAIAERVAALLRARTPGNATIVATPKPLPRAAVPTGSAVEALESTTVTLTLRGGRTLLVRLYAAQAPTAVARFVAQVKAGEWNGRTFHRVEPGFVVQGGSPAANEYAGAAAFARDEFSSLSQVRGTVGISTRGPDTGDGQIYVNLVDNARLDFDYTLIGSIGGDVSVIDDILEGEVILAAVAEAREVR
jgi:cyclophilin family peptidyl-prolyl cis-trans isomerase